jgi:hypothetical protein
MMARAFLFGLSAAAPASLAPLVARDLLHGNASTYGLLLGCSGVGAVVGALSVSFIRARFRAEQAFLLCAITSGLMSLIVGFSRHLALTGGAMLVAGGASILSFALLNVRVQMSVPRWVTARSLAWFQASVTGGVGIGALIWGRVAATWNLETTFYVSGTALMLTPLIRWLMPIQSVSPAETEMAEMRNEPEVALAITARSGPVVIEIDYRVDPAEARQFYDVMLKLQRARLRNGAFNASLSRDIGDPALWTERFHFPTWGDYLHLRSRFTQADRDLQTAADAFNRDKAGSRIRRRLERPLGSVRWREETPDLKGDTVNMYAP